MSDYSAYLTAEASLLGWINTLMYTDGIPDEALKAAEQSLVHLQNSLAFFGDCRVCDECGAGMGAGYVMDDDYCVCEECFEPYMAREFGGSWTGSTEQNRLGGYYSYTAEDGSQVPLNIYWTEWE